LELKNQKLIDFTTLTFYYLLYKAL